MLFYLSASAWFNFNKNIISTTRSKKHYRPIHFMALTGKNLSILRKLTLSFSAKIDFKPPVIILNSI